MTPWNKVKSWWNDMWNRFDLAMYLSFLSSVVMRYALDSGNFAWARAAYSLTLTMFFLRLLQFLFACTQLGSTVIMIGKMVRA